VVGLEVVVGVDGTVTAQGVVILELNGGFEPTLLNGGPIAILYNVTITFKIA
jgi:hypothetical protein